MIDQLCQSAVDQLMPVSKLTLDMSSQTLESMLACTKPQQEKKARPQDEAQKCPRCDSANTKFCYYNNYSLTQPRYFCKSCRRYWTKGGTLRNVPVGGGCRKKQRSSSSSKRSSPDNQISSLTQFSNYDPNDISLAFARLQNQESGQLVCPESHRTIRTEGVFPDSLCLANFENSATRYDILENRGMCTSFAEAGFLDALRGGFLETPNGFLHHYYGIDNNGNNNVGHVENASGLEMVTNFDEEIMRSGVTKEEMCSNMGRESENKILWGFPWQINGDGNNMADFEYSSTRQNWNGLVGVPSWHGLLNSPLM
ncbi:hypothetical protein HAX54_018711 [Datura stramonium]|uniref:Dof zinc finger protein n=1 Tax=Datura stramonium TaxID=4076 RepID=A0ABS8UMT6_DATST|nr:hypothetical protein [Datura stramonium]